MINLELSEQHAAQDKMMREVAKNLFRPISRKYDKQEHDVPVELKMLDRRPPRPAPGAQPVAAKPSTPAPAREEKKEKKKPEHVVNGNNMSSVVTVMQMCWGDVGLMLSVPGAGLGNAAIAAVATPEQKERFGFVYAGMAITEPASGSDSGSISTTAVLDGD
jgi:acyl-CoA dehydrogenase